MALTIGVRLAKEREDALRALDIGRVRKVLAEMGFPTDDVNDRTITIMMHKSRVASPALSIGERQFSVKWLREHGYSPLISAGARQ